ncbi:MAG: two-component system response regulator [Candidatus Sericytochromatia bacterium]
MENSPHTSYGERMERAEHNPSTVAHGSNPVALSMAPLPQILVIDDSESIVQLIQKILEQKGYEVLTATSALEGLELAHGNDPELILCDVQMPEHNGFFVLDQLREDPRLCLTPFIFISGEAIQRQDVRKGMNHGADDYLFKPFSAGELVEAVQVRLQRHALFRSEMPRLSRQDSHLRSYHRLERDLLELLAIQATPTLMILDIDRFKRVNDALGFQNADQMLRVLMQRFVPLREQSAELYHGPHAAQVVLLLRSMEADALPAFARQVLSLVAEPLDFQSYQLHLTASAGIYTIDGDDNPEEVLKKAFIAMNQAKQQGGNLFTLYQQDMHALITRQLIWENELHQALSHKSFVLHYQPQIDLISGEITGFEALIRLQHPELGLIYPGEFIQIAEESGLIGPIGDWCLRAACRQLKAWRQAGFGDLRVAVNVSVLQFQKGRFVQRVQEILKEHDLEGSALEIELTESALVSDLQGIQADLERLRELGITLAIDDFGTGYSSLSYLRHLPFNLLKIDQSFIRGMNDNTASLAIPKAIIDMGHSLGLEILAEGIETQQQMLLLKSYGCDLGQGYYLSKPLPAHEIELLLLQRASVA